MSTPNDYEPTQFTAGNTVEWTRSLPDYPADDGWALVYKIRGATTYSVSAAASGADHAVTIPAATSGAYTAGTYLLVGFVSKASERFQVYSGQLEILPDNGTLTSSYTATTHAQRMLTAIEAMLEGTATREEKRLKLAMPNGVERELEFFSRKELLEMWSFYKRQRADEVAAEAVANGRNPKRRILTRFTRPA